MNNTRTNKIVILAIIFAIMITFLILFPLNAIIPLIALMVIAETEDIKLAGLGGLLFGIASFLSALLFPSSPLYRAFLNPLVSIVTRILVGIFVWLIYKGLFTLIMKQFKIKVQPRDVYFVLEGSQRKKGRTIDYISLTIASVCGALINTTLVISSILLLYSGDTMTLNEVSLLVNSKVIIPLVLPSMISEPIVCGIVVPPIVTALKHVR